MVNWKTTLAGLVMILGAIAAAWSDPAKRSTPETIAQIAAGLGLVAAKDHDVTGGKRKADN